MKIAHHLQLAMINKLVESERSLKYGELKDDSVDNSLFSYHLNKLISRGLVVKSDEGYSVSVEGARWLNDNGIAMTEAEALRVYVALVIKNEDGEYLIAQRQGQFKSKINDYLLPSVRYTNELDISVQIDQAIDTFVPAESLRERKEYGFVQIKAHYHDDTTMRVLFDVTLCFVNNFDPAHMSEMSGYEWFSSEKLATIDHPSAEIIRGIVRYIEGMDERPVPVIVG